ncbi:MAG TPA: GNAT family N-acetyltransferase [Candidatus Nitrosotenuis sp.]|jgi:GNAT superfamily N-acetyltransferase|nr:GNAT family N-acetyltransferase [Candidatus Nitrosotenuis sp.]
MKQIYDLITPDHPELLTVIAPSIGNPTQEKIQRILKEYKISSWQLMGCSINEQLVAVIGLDLSPPNAIIKHISVLPEYRGLGIGKQLIHYALDYFCLSTLSAETDEDAVNFYQTLGFSCQPFNGKYGKRYKCALTRIEGK